jgi:hypothetical protein
MSSLLAGFAEVDWTPPPGLPLLGQLHKRIANHARDPLCASAMAVQQSARMVVLVSVDIAILDEEFVRAVQLLWAELSGLSESTLLLHATHTHVAPAATSLLLETADSDFLAHLQSAILQTAKAALRKLEPVTVFAGSGQIDEMGWNRRAMFEDGSSRMYGHSQMPGFNGMEGPRDPALPVMWMKNALNETVGVLLNFSTHPNSIESACVYSADVPGEVRKNLKRVFGDALVVLYLTGACGNTAPSRLDPFDEREPWRGEDGLIRSGLYTAGEVLKTMAATIEPMASPIFSFSSQTIHIPLRAWPQPDEASHPQSTHEYFVKAARDWPRRLKEENPVATRIHVLRIGDALICTNPAELFVEFGLQIRESSPARVTFVTELTDGYVGYVPTLKAFERGGYETWCALSSQLDKSAGDQIVRTTQQLSQQLFTEAKSQGN